METGYLYKNYKWALTLIAIVFFTVSMAIYVQSNFLSYRLMRAIICFGFLVLLLWYRKKRPVLVLCQFLFFYGVAGLMTLWYEIEWVAGLSIALSVAAYIVLIVALMAKVKLKGTSLILLMGAVVTYVIITYLLYELVEIIGNAASSNPLYLLIAVTAMIFILLSFLTILYNHRYSTKSTLVFSIFVFALIFSEIFRALGYYNIAYGIIAVYISRALFILGISLLVHYSLLNKKKEEVLSYGFFNNQQKPKP